MSYITQMKIIIDSWVFSLCLGILASNANAQDMYITTLREQSTVQDSAIQEFKAHLDQRIARLKERVPDLYLETPTATSKMGEFIRNSIYPAGPNYKNREVQCRFINRLLSEVSQPLLLRLQELTNNGKICIAGDLPKEQQVNWTSQWIQILWNEKWYVDENGSFSLEDLIIENIGTENYSKPDIIVAINEQFDGYGAGLSKALAPLYLNDPTLQKFRFLGSQFDPNKAKAEPFILLGQDIQNVLLEDSPYEKASLVRGKSEIYISPIWPVAELVELLVHEYGHVLHAEQTPNTKWDPVQKTLRKKMDGRHNEGVAEAFAEMLLLDVFKRHPETETFHLGKLRIFSEIRPQDNHLAGAIALNSIFYQGKRNFPELLNLIRTENFMDYLIQNNINALVPGPESTSTLEVFFKQ